VVRRADSIVPLYRGLGKPRYPDSSLTLPRHFPLHLPNALGKSEERRDYEPSGKFCAACSVGVALGAPPSRRCSLRHCLPTTGRYARSKCARSWTASTDLRSASWPQYVLQGELTFRFGDRTETAPAGSFVFVPPGVVHEFGNAGNAPARFLEFFVPGGSEGFHLERAALEQAKVSGPDGQYSNLDAETLRSGSQVRHRLRRVSRGGATRRCAAAPGPALSLLPPRSRPIGHERTADRLALTSGVASRRSMMLPVVPRLLPRL